MQVLRQLCSVNGHEGHVLPTSTREAARSSLLILPPCWQDPLPAPGCWDAPASGVPSSAASRSRADERPRLLRSRTPGGDAGSLAWCPWGSAQSSGPAVGLEEALRSRWLMSEVMEEHQGGGRNLLSQQPGPAQGP